MSKRLSVRGTVTSNKASVKTDGSSGKLKVICRMVCKFPFSPEEDDEIELKENDVIDVTKKQLEEGDDEWAEGFNTRSKMLGIFPTTHCTLVASSIPKPKFGGEIYEANFEFDPKKDFGQEDSDEENEYIYMGAGEFVEYLPKEDQEEMGGDESWVAVYHCSSLKKGIVPLNRIKKVENMPSDAGSVAPRLSVAPGKSGNGKKVRKSIMGVPTAAATAKEGDAEEEDTVILNKPKYFKAISPQIPEFDEDLVIKVGDILLASERTKDDEAYFGYIMGRADKQEGFFLVEIVQEISEKEATGGSDASQQSKKQARMSMRKSIRPADLKLGAQSNDPDMIPVDQSYHVKAFQDFDVSDSGSDELKLAKNDVVHVTHYSKSENGEWVYGTNLSSSKFGIFPLDFTERCNEQGEVIAKNRSGAAGGSVVGMSSEMVEKIENFESQFNTLKDYTETEMKNINEKVVQIEFKIDDLKNESDSNRTSIQELKDSTVKTLEKTQELETKLNEFNLVDLNEKISNNVETSAKLTEKVEILEDTFKGIQNELENGKELNQKNYESLNDDLSATKVMVEEMKEQQNAGKNELGPDMNQLKSDLENNNETLKLIQASVDEVKDSKDTLESKVDSSLEEVNSKFDSRIGEVELSLSQNGEKMSEMLQKIDSMQQGPGETELDELKKSNEEIQSKLESVEEKMKNELDEQCKEMEEKVEKLNQEIAAVGDAQQEFAKQSDIELITDQLNSEAKQIEDFKTRLESNEKYLKALTESKLDDNKDSTVDIQVVQGLRVDLERCTQTTEEMQNGVDNRLRETNETLEGLKDQIETLAAQNLGEKLQQVTNDQERAESTLKTHGSSLDDLKSELKNLKTNVEELKKPILSLEAAAATGTASALSDSEELKEKLERISQRVETSQSLIDRLEAGAEESVKNGVKLAQLESKLETIDRLEERLEERIKHYDEQLQRLEQQQTEIKQASIATQQSQNPLEKKDDASHSDFGKKYEKIKSVVAKQAQKLIDLETNFDSLKESKLGGTAAGSSDSGEKFEKLKQEFDDLKKELISKETSTSRKLTTMRAQIQKLQGTAGSQP